MSGSPFYIDCHAHLTPEPFLKLKNAFDQGLRHVFLGGTDPSDWAQQLKWKATLPAEYSRMLRLHFGLHPWWVEKMDESEMESALLQLEKILPEADGLGESGLDFGPKRDPAQFLKQERAFRRQLELSAREQKPLVLHIVHAHARALAILNESQVRTPFLVHRYSGNVTELNEYLKQGALISYDLALMSERGYEKTKKSFLHTPLESLLLETDQDEPAKVIALYQWASLSLGIPIVKLQEIVAENIKKIGYTLAQHESPN